MAQLRADRILAADVASRSHASVSSAPAVVPVSTSPSVKPVSSGDRAATVVAYARKQLGKPYRFATAGPGSFDCSGLAKAAYARVGVSIPHQTGGIIKMGRAVKRGQLRRGDLVFPSSGHVGIYIGDGLMIHAPKPGDHVRIAKIYSFWAARRLL